MTEESTQDKLFTPPTISRRSSVGLFLGAIALWLCLLHFTGILTFDTYIGAFSIEEVILTNDARTGFPGYSPKPNTVFPSVGDIFIVVQTSGKDSILHFRWYRENEPIQTTSLRANNSQLIVFLEGTQDAPLLVGNYRVEVWRRNSVEETRHFTVEPFVLEVIPPQPTPIGHTPIGESRKSIEIPFAFDETWQTSDGQEWQINEVKIASRYEAFSFQVVVSSDMDFSAKTFEETYALTKVIASYAIENGYLDQARNIQINGKTYDFLNGVSILIVSSTGEQQQMNFTDMDDSSS